MLELILGNICSLIAMGTDAVSSWAKSARKMLLFQCLSQGIYAVGSVILKGYSAAVQNAISLARNLFATRKRSLPVVEWILIALGVGLGLFFNNRSWIGLLPVVANLEYSLAVLFFKDNEQLLKIAFFIDVLLFCIFNTVIFNIVGTVSNIVVMIMTLLAILKNVKEKKQAK
ncbi:MAG: YgjV family protein [Oscillospiraceae bacterium]|nr:YgjV family protein [Oscillospiraceae bacterium]